jgi:hypothetical protein
MSNTELNRFLCKNAELIRTGRCHWLIPPGVKVDRICAAYRAKGWIVEVEGNFLVFTPKEGSV